MKKHLPVGYKAFLSPGASTQPIWVLDTPLVLSGAMLTTVVSEGGALGTVSPVNGTVPIVSGILECKLL